VKQLSYSCGEQDGVEGLWRYSRSIAQVRALIEPEPVLLLPDCERLTIRYAYLPPEGASILEWQEQWLYPEDLPRFIAISLEFEAGSGMARTITIPQGILKLAAESSGGGA